MARHSILPKSIKLDHLLLLFFSTFSLINFHSPNLHATGFKKEGRTWCGCVGAGSYVFDFVHLVVEPIKDVVELINREVRHYCFFCFCWGEIRKRRSSNGSSGSSGSSSSSGNGDVGSIEGEDRKVKKKSYF